MMVTIYKIFLHALMITGFVFIMMLVIEYINVQSKGLWQKNLSKNKWRQYLIAGFLGAIPGCLGAFTMVAMFSHKLVSFGALVTTMIATSGDEAFVMFAMSTSFMMVSILSIRLLRHCPFKTFNSISAIFNQLPCFGVKTNSKRSHILLACFGENLSKDGTITNYNNSCGWYIGRLSYG